MVAVVLGVSGLNGYAWVLAAFDVHEHGHHAPHSHAPQSPAAHDHDGLDAESLYTALDQGQNEDDPASADHICAHVHAHCCGSFAVAAQDYALSVNVVTPSVVPVARSHIPPGELASPLFRPPRAIA